MLRLKQPAGEFPPDLYGTVFLTIQRMRMIEPNCSGTSQLRVVSELCSGAVVAFVLPKNSHLLRTFPIEGLPFPQVNYFNSVSLE